MTSTQVQRLWIQTGRLLRKARKRRTKSSGYLAIRKQMMTEKLRRGL